MNKSIFFLFLQAIKEDRTNAEENYTLLKDIIENQVKCKKILAIKRMLMWCWYESVGKWFLIL